MTQTERRALKEHINIPDCVQRRVEESGAQQCVYVFVCMYVLNSEKEREDVQCLLVQTLMVWSVLQQLH